MSHHVPIIRLTSLDEGFVYIACDKVLYVADAQGAGDAQAKLYFHGGVTLFVTETAFYVKHQLNCSEEEH